MLCSIFLRLYEIHDGSTLNIVAISLISLAIFKVCNLVNDHWPLVVAVASFGDENGAQREP